jgi:hypothetical protein
MGVGQERLAVLAEHLLGSVSIPTEALDVSGDLKTSRNGDLKM